MEYRELGRSGIRVSCIGLGGSPLGGGLFQERESLALDLVRHAFDRGITFFDTSNNYGMGRSEEIIGEALRGRRDRAVIATKGGAQFTAAARIALALRPALRPLRAALRPFRRGLNLARDAGKRYDYSAAGLRRSLEASLTRLRTDHVDIYQLYNPTPGTSGLDEAFETLDRFRQEGKARYVGLSVNRVSDASELLRRWRADSLQLPLSLLDQGGLDGQIERCAAAGIGVIARSVLGQGLLTNARGHVMADESSHYTVEALRTRRERRKHFESLISPDRTLAQAALRFALQQPGVSSALVAAVTIEQLEENLAALAAPALTQEEMLGARGLAVSEPGA
ncbi:MAG: aldo/keto reductase [Pseudomonadota bacterium]|nr:aldo/keto reductase [Pseudomonadota bacterium]